ncbi:hypothetical protein [Blautia sp.]|jgi:hypothetical protein|uniref:hypothetical protein n=1 Tax=Blautia sp. TaxID=1955243 RepID=UPI00294260A7|nr:hypothetical protein [Blautia sp.]MDY3017653.1 hypothetical protein [Blautia sp.]MED9883448.1 hypothetical protein [Blautia sp.]
MKIVKGLAPFLLLVFAVSMIIGCSHSEKADVKGVITNELDLLKNLDSDTVQKYISYKELFPDATEKIELSREVEEVFSLFFQDFDYKILRIKVDKDKKEASASLKLTTIDAKALAKDYTVSHLKDAILNAADSASHNTEEQSDSMEDRYLILNELLKDHTYKTVETDCTLTLQNNGTDREDWEIRRSHDLENSLVGGLITYLSDSDLLTPEETLTVYLNTLKTMDQDQMSNYLGLESLLTTSDSAKNSIASALVEQMHKTFDFKITDSDVESYHAVIQTEITTFDSDAILKAYQEELDEYLASPDAVIDGPQKRYNHSLELLLHNIEKNTGTLTHPAVFVLTNDGASWKLQDDGHSIGAGIFGNLSVTPLAEEENPEE